MTKTLHPLPKSAARLTGYPWRSSWRRRKCRVFTPSEIAQRLKADLTFLNNGRANVERHITLEAAIAWSEHLLQPIDLLLLHRMSIFASSARFSAIQTVCADEELPASFILPALTRLVDKSLVFTVPSGEHMRFGMLGTIKRVAFSGLELSGGRAEMELRHARWAQQLALEAGAGVLTRDSIAWVQRLAVEYENLSAAITFGLEHDLEMAAVIVADLAWFCLWRDRLGDARGWTHAILAKQQDSISLQTRARVLYADALTRAWTADFGGAMMELDEAQRIALAENDEELTLLVSELYTIVAVYGGDSERARELLEEIEAQGVPEGLPLFAAMHDFLAGLIARASGNLSGSLILIDSAQRQLRAFGELFILCACLNEAARTHHLNGDIHSAERLYRECHELALRTQNSPLLTSTFFGIAEVCQLAGNLREALDWFEAGIEHLKGLGKRVDVASVLGLAYVAGGAGLHALSVSLYSAASIRWPIGEALSSIVEVPYRQQFTRSHTFLGEAEFQRAAREGAYWSLENALEQGLARLHASLSDGQQNHEPGTADSAPGRRAGTSQWPPA